MILLVHMLLGALIGQKIINPFWAVILAFLSHYFLDIFPHIEYPIENIKNKMWKKSAPDIFRVFLDFYAGIILILFFSSNSWQIYICAFFAILPDGLSLLWQSKFHEKIHFLKHKKISVFWRILSQVAVVLLCLGFFIF